MGYEGLYEVSNLGRVRSLPRNGTLGGILKQTVDRYGYMKVVLHKDNKPRYCTAHRIVASAFIENPEGKKTVDHIDCNRKNNNADNLRWTTMRENLMHSHKLGRQRWNARPIVATSPDGETFICASQHEAEKVSGVTQTNVGKCANGKAKTVKGWKFEYGSYENLSQPQ